MSALNRSLPWGVTSAFLSSLVVTTAMSCAHREASLSPATSAKAKAKPITEGIETEAAMKSVLEKEIPPGTNLADAQRLMEQEGFKCEMHRQRLFCDRHDRVGFAVSRRWMIGMSIEGDRIKNVDVKTGLIGL